MHGARAQEAATATNTTTREKGHTERVFSYAFSNDGTRLVSASLDCTARVWDVASGACVHVFGGHKNALCSVDVSASGLVALTSCRQHVMWFRLADYSFVDSMFVNHAHTVRFAPWSDDARAQELFVRTETSDCEKGLVRLLVG